MTPDRLAEWFSPDLAVPFGRLEHRPLVTVAPRIDVAERDRTLIVLADLPGVRKQDLDVQLHDGALVIRGNASMRGFQIDAEYVRIERNVGSYYRRVPLPFEASAEGITTTFMDGILEVCIPEPDREWCAGAPASRSSMFGE